MKAGLSQSRWRWAVIALAALIPLGFAAWTQHAWEDFFITLRSSRHLAEGQGLVFQPGERVHTFTSPLGVLLPALGWWLTGAGETGALWFLRVVGAGLLAWGAALLWRRSGTLGLGPLGRVVLFGLVLADAKLTDFAINGMETAVLVFFVVWFWSELEAPDGLRPARLGLAAAGLMWTRPDAFILAGALAVPHLIFRENDAAGVRRVPLVRLGQAAAIGVAFYLPWLVWAWLYYGSPVPNTIIAKAAYTPPVHVRDLLLLPWRLLRGETLGVDLFLPSYQTFGGWPAGFSSLAAVLVNGAAWAWLVPGWSRAGRRVSLAVWLGMFYISSIILFPWYVPPWTVLAALALAFAADAVYRSAWVRRRAWAAAVWRMACVVVLVVQVGVLLATAAQMRVHERVVEQGVRRAIGRWLAAQAAPGDTVFLEPLGYIGYYSQLKMYDFPGLSSPEVVAAVRGGAKSYAALIAQLRPTWVVLRPNELARPDLRVPAALADYDYVAVWDARPQLASVSLLPGRPWCEFEACYLVYHRKPAAR